MKNEQESIAQVSAAEWILMECLWANGPLYMSDIVSKLSEKTQWSRTTVLTLASRLEKKGYIGTERSTKAYLYVPVIGKKQALNERVQAFVDETFSGDYYALAKLIAEGAKLSVSEEKKLRARFKALQEAETETDVAPIIKKKEVEPLALRKLESLVPAKRKNKDKSKSKDKKGGKKNKKK